MTLRVTNIDDTWRVTTAENIDGREKPHRFSGVVDRFLAFRDRCLTSSAFIRFAERFPLTRGIARREASALFDLCSGFVYSQVLLACVRLRLFDHLRAGPLAVSEIAARIKLGEDSARRLLVAASALRLVEERSGGRFGLGGLGAAMLASPGLAAMIEHHALLYRDLHDPVQLLRSKDGHAHGGSPQKSNSEPNLAAYWPYAEGDTGASTQAVSDYTALMAATQPAIAQEILDAYDLKRHHGLMDVGGGDGTFLMSAAKHAPHLRLTLFDLPAVAEMARKKIAEAGLTSRANAVGGDFVRDLPQGADVITLIRVLLDHNDETALTILKMVRSALPADGVLLVAEPMAQTKGAEKVAAYFSFYLLAMGRGRPRTERQLRFLMSEAGFAQVRAAVTCQPLLTRLLVAHP